MENIDSAQIRTHELGHIFRIITCTGCSRFLSFSETPYLIIQLNSQQDDPILEEFATTIVHSEIYDVHIMAIARPMHHMSGGDRILVVRMGTREHISQPISTFPFQNAPQICCEYIRSKARKRSPTRSISYSVIHSLKMTSGSGSWK